MSHRILSIAVYIIGLLSITISCNTMSSTNIQNPKTYSYLALGDSYTKGESVALSQSFPYQLAKSMEGKLMSMGTPTVIAQTGWRTDDLKKAIEQTQPSMHDIVSLLIGVNNFYQGKSAQSFKPEFEALLSQAIALANGNKDRVLVLSIPDYGYTPFGQADQVRISAGIDAFNKVCEEVSHSLGVKYVYITDLSRKGLQEPSLVAQDGLHPSGAAYAQYVARVAPALDSLLSR